MLGQFKDEKDPKKKRNILDKMKDGTVRLKKVRANLADIEREYINKASYDTSYSENIKISKDDMEKLHSDGEVEVDGEKVAFEEGKKRFRQQDGIGKAKYTISYHDGKQKHKDGSDFFGIQIFKNKKDLETFRNALLKKGYIEESVNEGVEPQIKKIAYFTGTRPEAVEDFVSKHALNITKLLKYVQKGGLPQRMELVSALAGRPNNPKQKKIIKQFQESVNEAYIVTYAKKKGEKPASAAFQLRGSALSFERDLKKDGYITMVTQKKVKGIDESINEANPSLNKKVKAFLDKGLKDLSKGRPNHHFAVMNVLMGALTDANFHSESKKVPSFFPKAKYEGDPMGKQDAIGIYEEMGENIAKWAKWDGYDIIDAFSFYTNMVIGGGFGKKLETLKESVVNEAKIKKVNKSKWNRMKFDDKVTALLSVVKDPDDAEEYAESNWEDLPSGFERDMVIYESVNEGISVSDERHFGKKGIIIMIDDNGKKISAIFKDKKNADKFNRNNPSDIKKLLQLAKGKKFPQAIDEEFKSKDSTFEKVYGIFDKRDYFNAKGLAKTQIGNFERALKKNDKGAQQILDKFKGDMGKSKEYIIQVISDQKKTQAYENYKALKMAVDSIQKGKPEQGAVGYVKRIIHNNNQKYSIALYSALRNQKFTKWKDIHNDIDSLIK
jgi:hypothetical protein